MRTRLLAVAGTALVVVSLGVYLPAAAQNARQEVGGLSFRTTTFNNGLGFGARAMGMAGAFTAIADDASAASWNPAGLGQLIRPEITVVGGYNSAKIETSNESAQFFSPTTAKSQLFIRTKDRTADANSYGADFFSFVQPFKLGRQLVTTQLSYARNARPLNGTEDLRFDYFDRPGGTDFAPDIYNTKVSSFGGYDSFGIGFGTGFDEKFYIGFTVNYWTGSTSTSTDSHVRFFVNNPAGGQSLFGDFNTQTFDEQRYSGLSASVGILVKPTPKLSIGLTYRGGWAGSDVYQSKFSQAGFYTFNVTQGSTTTPQYLPFRSSASQTSNGTLTWPDTVSGGIAFRPVEALTLALDGSTTQWHRSSISRLPVSASTGNCTFGTDNVLNCPVGFTEVAVPFPSQTTDDALEQNNQIAFRFGVEYVLRPGSLILPLRAGIYRIKTIAPLYETADQDPDVNFDGITAGLGLVLPFGNGSLLFDAAAVFDKASTSRSFDRVLETGRVRLTGDREVKNSRYIGSLIYRF